MKAICALAVLSCLVLIVLSSCNADIVVFLFGTENDEPAADMVLAESNPEFSMLSWEDLGALDFTRGLDSSGLFTNEYWELNIVALDSRVAELQEAEIDASADSFAAASVDSFSSLDSIELELWSMQAQADAFESPDFKYRKAKRIVELNR